MLQFILHHDDDVLHLGLIGLGTRGIDLATHLLSDETQFLALTRLVGHGLAEILQMIGQALLLLADVQLLNIIYQFLLQAVLVVFCPGNLLQAVDDALANLLYPTLLVWFYRQHQPFNIVSLLGKLLLQGRTLLGTEIHQMLYSLADTLSRHGPFLITENLNLCLRQHVRHAHQRRHPVRTRQLMVVGKAAQLLVVAVHQRRIHRHSICRSILFHPEAELHFSAYDPLGNQLTDFHFFLAIDWSNTCGQVKLLGVERLDFHIDFLSLVGYDSLAVTRH